MTWPIPAMPSRDAADLFSKKANLSPPKYCLLASAGVPPRVRCPIMNLIAIVVVEILDRTPDLFHSRQLRWGYLGGTLGGSLSGVSPYSSSSFLGMAVDGPASGALLLLRPPCLEAARLPGPGARVPMVGGTEMGIS